MSKPSLADKPTNSGLSSLSQAAATTMALYLPGYLLLEKKKEDSKSSKRAAFIPRQISVFANKRGSPAQMHDAESEK